MSLLHSRRLAELLADVTEGALLVEEAAWALRPSRRRPQGSRCPTLRRSPSGVPVARGILDSDRTVLDLFEPIVRYGPIEASDLAA